MYGGRRQAWVTTRGSPGVGAVGMNRADAWALLNEYTTEPSLIKHALAVEACMRAYARRFAEDEERWGIVGLLHDFDYQRWPDPADHPLRGADVLADRGYPPDVIRAIKSHAEYLTDCPRESVMEKTLFACDELTGMVVATALVRPSRSVHDLTARSVKNKMKAKGFARAVNRDHILSGAAELGVDLAEHIQFVIESMRAVAAELDLAGAASIGRE